MKSSKLRNLTNQELMSEHYIVMIQIQSIHGSSVHKRDLMKYHERITQEIAIRKRKQAI